MRYCTRLKTFADQLSYLGQPVSGTQKLFNMIRGLGYQYHVVTPHLTSRGPLPTFLHTRSFLLLEEHRAEQTAQFQPAHALVAARSTASPPTPAPAPPVDSRAGRRYDNRGKRCGRGNQGASSSTTAPPPLCVHPLSMVRRAKQTPGLVWCKRRHRQTASAPSPPSGRTLDWYLDTGASSHMAANYGTRHSILRFLTQIVVAMVITS